MRSIVFLFVLFVVCSCAKGPIDELNEAIDVAQSLLSKKKCQEAIDLLEAVGPNNDHPIYLKVLSSAYACRAEFDAIEFIDELNDLNTTTTATLMRSLSIMALSDESTVDSSTYSDLKTALGVLLYANGDAQPTHAGRVASFGTRQAGDMSMQIIMFSLQQFGKFLNLYGNVNSIGTKGAGVPAENSCFINYTYGPAQAVITSGVTGACTSHNKGHTGLDHTTTAGRRRLCEGLVLFTNILDVAENLEITSDSLSSLNNFASTAGSLRDLAIAADPDLETLLTTTSQSVCETTLGDPDEVENLQHIYAMLYETGLQ